MMHGIKSHKGRGSESKTKTFMLRSQKQSKLMQNQAEGRTVHGMEGE